MWRQGGSRVKTLRYSGIHSERIGTVAKGFEDDPAPLNTLPELA